MQKVKYCLLASVLMIVPISTLLIINSQEKLPTAALVLLLVALSPTTIYLGSIIVYLEFKSRRILFNLTGIAFIAAAVLTTNVQTNEYICLLNMIWLTTGLWLVTNRVLFFLSAKLIDGNWWRIFLQTEKNRREKENEKP